MKPEEQVEVVALGSGSEVGRSCIVATFKGKRVMFDCGIHPARTGYDSLPQFDSIDCSTIDIALITHFHLDHCGAVPYLCMQTNFKGKMFMTHPTKAIYRKIMQDFARLNGSESVVSEDWIEESMSRIQTIDFHQVEVVNGISITAYNAGHVLGAAMFFIEIMGVKIMYTGDYSRYPDRHLLGAETPPHSPDILILESTYGIQVHESQQERESKFVKWIHDIVRAPRNGKCLIPVFALGRAQELLLVLEDYWAKNRDLHGVPIYFISSMSSKFDQLYDYYKYQLNEEVQEEDKSPFAFKYISCKKDLKDFADIGPCVVLASPGMLQTGVSRELFERWCTEARNGVIIAGYCVEGTLAKTILDRPREIIQEDGKILPLKMDSIYNVSFSAHSDFAQTKDFVTSISGTRQIVLVHGNPDAVSKLSERLMSEFADRKLIAHISINSQPISLPVKSTMHARAYGSLVNQSHTKEAQKLLLLTSKVTGESILIAPNEISKYTSQKSAQLNFGCHIPCPSTFKLDDMRMFMSRPFDHCCLKSAKDGSAYLWIDESVKIGISCVNPGGKPEERYSIFVQWEMDAPNTLALVESICVYIMEYLRAPASGSVDTTSIGKSGVEKSYDALHSLLKNTFRNVQLNREENIFTFEYMGETDLSVHISSLEVNGGTPFVRSEISQILDRFHSTRKSIRLS